MYTFSRFSLAVSAKGTPDTSRNVRGFSTKFYTRNGNYDLLCNHIPVFLVRDAIKFPASIRSLSPSPVNNLTSAEPFWRFVAENPEATHFVTWLYSDLGTVASLRHIRAYGVNTYVWKNANREKFYVKYHWLPVAGERSINRQEAVRLAGENPDIAGQELCQAIASGKPVEYELCVQLMAPSMTPNLSYDPLDDTKVWDEAQFPLIKVGCLSLDRNVDDYFNQVEKSAFSPVNLIQGIELSNDKMLQGRSFIYWDAQRRRLGPDFRSVPVNYEENWTPRDLLTGEEGDLVSGAAQRSDILRADNFTQAGEHYLSLPDVQKEHLADNIASEMYAVPDDICMCVLDYFQRANQNFYNQVRQRIAHYRGGNL